jgi:hypothetical protein
VGGQVRPGRAEAGQVEPRNIRIHIDEPRNALVVQANAARLGQVAAVLQRLEELGPADRIGLRFHEASWSKVFTWFVEQIGRPIITNFKPRGMFSFAPPDPRRSYTAVEVFDLFNEGLRRDGYALLCRRKSLRLVLLERPEEKQQWIRFECLRTLDEEKFAQVAIRLRAPKAEKVAPQVKKMLGPEGEVGVERRNELVLLDAAGNLRRVGRLLLLIERQTQDARAARDETGKRPRKPLSPPSHRRG